MDNNEFKKVRIKNCTCYYFDNIIKLEDFDIDNILLIHDISYKTLIGAKPLRTRFDKIYGFIRIYDGTRYLVLLGSEKYEDICNRMRDLISLKSSIIYVFSHYYAKINADSYDSLPIEKRLTLLGVTILIKSVLNKDQNHYYYEIFLEKCFYQLAKNQSQIFFLIV